MVCESLDMTVRVVAFLVPADLGTMGWLYRAGNAVEAGDCHQHIPAHCDVKGGFLLLRRLRLLLLLLPWYGSG